MTSNFRIFAAVLLLAAALVSGCVVVVDDRPDGSDDWDVSWAGSSDVQRVASDDALAKEVSRRLAATAAGDQDVSVSERDAVVTLHGRVDSVAALEEAMAVAADTPGVSRVVSRLTVVREGS
ncbi:MAG: BON domain-containing protein [Gammaproteobacteria bacterium]